MKERHKTLACDWIWYPVREKNLIIDSANEVRILFSKKNNSMLNDNLPNRACQTLQKS